MCKGLYVRCISLYMYVFTVFKIYVCVPFGIDDVALNKKIKFCLFDFKHISRDHKLKICCLNNCICISLY